jgi:hypothetical protein
VRTWIHPFGNPAWSNKGAIARVPRGVFSDGLTIITFPVAKAGAALIIMVATGALNGLIAAHTPKGSWRTILVNPELTDQRMFSQFQYNTCHHLVGDNLLSVVRPSRIIKYCVLNISLFAGWDN